jgi:hypothetical protein
MTLYFCRAFAYMVEYVVIFSYLPLDEAVKFPLAGIISMIDLLEIKAHHAPSQNRKNSRHLN